MDREQAPAITQRTARTCRLAVADVLLDRLLHDLKQPLNLVRVTAQDVRIDLRKERLDLQSLPKSMRDIEEGIDTVVRRVDQLRIFLRGDSEADVVSAADPNAVCHTVAERARSAFADVAVAEVLQPHLPWVPIGPSALEQALWELLDNGVRAARQQVKQRPEVTLSTARRDAQTVIAVTDNGGGIAESMGARIFEPFLTSEPRHAGMGLALALAIVQRAGGQLTLVGPTPDGTVFEILLPTSSVPTPEA
jgi:signal transduction histidine kinase